MPAPYSFTRRTDGPGNPVFAAHMNEVQQAIEELGALVAPSFIAGQARGSETALSGQFVSNVITSNALYATPFWTGEDGVIFTTLSIMVNTAAAGNARLGIYSAHPTMPYAPNALLLDAGTVSVSTTGVKTIDIADTLYQGASPHRLIWLALVANVTPILHTFIFAKHPSIPFDGVGAVPAGGYYMNHTYAALPATFDNPPDGLTNVMPAIWTVIG
jgi:hypothetical protein